MFAEGGLLRGRVGVRLESLENGEGPCALVRAQERMRSIYDGESGEAFFIDGETRENWSCPEEVEGGRWKVVVVAADGRGGR